MASRKFDGGQAFPAAYTVGPSGDLYPPELGMSLRDWFAGQALAGLLASGTFLSPDGLFTGNGAPVLADAADMLADAMLAARQKAGLL